MFGVLRLILFTACAFVVGVLYERANTGNLCTQEGGVLTGGVCRGVDHE